MESVTPEPCPVKLEKDCSDEEIYQVVSIPLPIFVINCRQNINEADYLQNQHDNPVITEAQKIEHFYKFYCDSCPQNFETTQECDDHFHFKHHRRVRISCCNLHMETSQVSAHIDEHIGAYNFFKRNQPMYPPVYQQALMVVKNTVQTQKPDPKAYVAQLKEGNFMFKKPQHHGQKSYELDIAKVEKFKRDIGGYYCNWCPFRIEVKNKNTYQRFYKHKQRYHPNEHAAEMAKKRRNVSSEN